MAQNPASSPQPTQNVDITEEAMERSSSLFSQLDAMISAVQSESSALDNMRDRVRELDGMKEQMNKLTRKLLESDQLNITLKANMVKMNDVVGELKQGKREAENKLQPLKNEMQRMSDACGRERQTRLNLQKELEMYKEHMQKQDHRIYELQNELTTMVPNLKNTNEALHKELNNLRQKYQEERVGWQKQIKHVHLKLELEKHESMKRLKNQVKAVANSLLSLSQLSESEANEAAMSHISISPMKDTDYNVRYNNSNTNTPHGPHPTSSNFHHANTSTRSNSLPNNRMPTQPPLYDVDFTLENEELDELEQGTGMDPVVETLDNSYPGNETDRSDTENEMVYQEVEEKINDISDIYEYGSQEQHQQKQSNDAHANASRRNHTHVSRPSQGHTTSSHSNTHIQQGIHKKKSRSKPIKANNTSSNGHQHPSNKMLPKI